MDELHLLKLSIHLCALYEILYNVTDPHLKSVVHNQNLNSILCNRFVFILSHKLF